MTEHDFTNYQSAETAWRYDVQLRHWEERCRLLRNDLNDACLELTRLRQNPPLYRLFNWSA